MAMDFAEGRRGPVEGPWWQLSLTMRSEEEPSAVSLLCISRDRDGGLTVNGRAWKEDGTLSARYWSEALSSKREVESTRPLPSKLFGHRSQPTAMVWA